MSGLPILAASDRAYILPLGDLRPGRSHISGYGILIRSAGEVTRTDLPPEQLTPWIDAQGAEQRRRLSITAAQLAKPPKQFLGLDLGQPVVMGIVNVTPDSFSDGGETPETASAVARGRAMAEAGATMLDVGGESTRPGAAPVTVDAEIDRVVPVIAELRGLGLPISVDTRNAPVMAKAAEAGADCINDVMALTGGPDSLSMAARLGLPVILMHMLGEPGTMQQAPHYEDALLDVYDYLEGRVEACVAAGMAREDIAVDPGIGFGKNDQHNLRLIGGLAMFRGLGCPIVLGVSRKSMIGRLSGVEIAKDRLPGSIALALAGLSRGAAIIRVHDVAETVQAIRLWQAVPGP